MEDCQGAKRGGAENSTRNDRGSGAPWRNLRQTGRIAPAVWARKFLIPVLAGLLILLPLLVSGETACAADDWYVSGYYARLTDADLEDTLSGRFAWEDAHIVVLGLGRRLISLGRYLDFELEGQVGKHLGDQDHFEFNLLLIARWLVFPWNDHLRTTLAVGNGVSYATDIPEVEEKNHSETSRLLDYLMFEFTFGLPQYPQWDLIARLHHRSGAYGLYNGVTGASNALAWGVRYHF